ncbi:DedA family protein [Nostoc sp. 106C]|uniref:DedA family protein n=1 Tax=Nostoc sp. 106C TaxID=1932667 RepID=UPI000A3A5C2F|nr:DedA family protein [Nostoc sp. 106C]OUL24469.1 alkaline phosphatase [Nostoc sp. RF31YmG]OUL29990.1 alkaline phosphatase [Nostoc sp. 106C]
MLEWITHTITKFDYWGIALLMFLENLFPPIPSELIMPLAGFTASPYQPGGAKLNIFGVFFAGLLGSVVGALIWYYPGKFLGEERLRALADKYGKWLAISSKDITKATRWFGVKGRKAVLIGRLVPGIRTLISVPAGISNLPLIPFLFYTTLGSAAWVCLLTYSGYLLGSQYELVDKYLAPVSKILLGSLVLAFAIWVFKRKRKSPRK